MQLENKKTPMEVTESEMVRIISFCNQEMQYLPVKAIDPGIVIDLVHCNYKTQSNQ